MSLLREVKLRNFLTRRGESCIHGHDDEEAPCARITHVLIQFLAAGNSRLSFVANVNFETTAMVVDLGPETGELLRLWQGYSVGARNRSRRSEGAKSHIHVRTSVTSLPPRPRAPALGVPSRSTASSGIALFPMRTASVS